MSLTVKHPFTSAIADDPTAAAAGQILPQAHWNANHTVTGSVDATQMPALTGDVTTVAGAVATTLATVNSNTGTFGDSTHVAQVTVNGKGLITAASSVALSTSSGANPTASVGLSAVNGAAATFMRSDASPPIDQSIAPTWTGAHKFGISIQFGLAGSYSSTLALSAANVLGLLNGTNPQSLFAYNTINGSDYERGGLDWNSISNALVVGTSKGGVGSNRDLYFNAASTLTSFINGQIVEFWSGNGRSGNRTIAMNFGPGDIRLGYAGNPPLLGFSSSGDAVFYDSALFSLASGVISVRGSSSSTGGALEFLEQTAPSAPGANGARIFAQDNGSGKTQLMVIFNSGAAQQIAIQP